MSDALPELTGPAGSVLYPPGARIGPRLLADAELVLLVSGEAELSVGGPPVRLGPGGVALLRPGMRDSWTWAEHGSTRHLYVHFTLRPWPPEAAGWPLVRDWPPVPAVAVAFRELLRLSAPGAGPGAAATARTWLAALLATVVHGTADAVADSPAGQGPAELGLRRAVEHVRRRWAAEGLAPVSREELAAAAALSVGHLARAWRAEHGMGPAASLEWVRLLQAVPLLERSALPLHRIAASTGFADAAHLSHRFRARLGVAPSSWRRQAAAGQAPAAPAPVAVTRLATVLLDVA